MKKKLIILVLLATVAFQSFGISSTDLKYRYTSYGRGYSSATYEGTNRTVDKLKKYRELRNILEGDSSTIVYDCDKLSMLESSLLWEAMKEFDYRTGEIYSFRICTGDFFSSPWLEVWAEVKDAHNISWYGFYWYLWDRSY